MQLSLQVSRGGRDGGRPRLPRDHLTGAPADAEAYRTRTWWPDLDQVIEAARGFYPGSLSETGSVTLASGQARAG